VDLISVGAKQDAILRDLAEAAGGADWEELKLFWSSVGSGRALWVLTLDGAGTIGSLDPPGELNDRLADLKDAMYEPEKGAWFLTEITLNRRGGYTVDFTYDRRVYWNEDSLLDPYRSTSEQPVPSDQMWRDELARYPRPAPVRPGWLPPP
jgi:hypothetical protein